MSGREVFLTESTIPALSAVLECAIPQQGAWPDLLPLLEVVRAGTGVEAVALVRTDQPPERSLLATPGLTGVQRDALVAAAGKAHHDRQPLEADAVVAGAVVPGRTHTHLVCVGGEALPHTGTLLQVAAQRVSQAMEIGRLRSDLERAMAQILESDERLLGRIGLDIHDGPTQHLSVALLELQLLDSDLQAWEGELPPSLAGALERIYETVGGALTEMRELIGHLRPAQFEDRRLADILKDAIVGFESRSGATVTTDMQGEFAVNGVSITQRITFYRILQEALGNAYRHGKARNAHVTVIEDDAGIRLEVRDDGVGFDAEHALRPRTGAPIARFGLHGMRDRATVLGGTFEVTSAAGEGSTVRVFLPRWMPPGGDSDDGA